MATFLQHKLYYLYKCWNFHIYNIYLFIFYLLFIFKEKERDSFIHSFIQHYGQVLGLMYLSTQPPRRQLLWCLVGGLAGRPVEHPKTKPKPISCLPFVLRGQPPTTISSAFLSSWNLEGHRTEPNPPFPHARTMGIGKLIKER